MQPLYSNRTQGVYGVHDRYTGATLGFVMRDGTNRRKWRAVRRVSDGTQIHLVEIPGPFDSRREATSELTGL